MRRALAATLLMITGGALLRLVLSQQHLRYVKEAMSVPLMLAAGTLIVLGLAGWWLATSKAPAPHGPGEAEPVSDPGAPVRAHVHLPAVAWLLLVPVLAIYLAPPAALGADAVLRESDRAAAPSSSLFPPLAPGDPVDLAPQDVVQRVLYDPEGEILDRRVRVTGFAVPLDGGGWYVARISLSCCAADGVAYRLYVQGAPAPAADEWVSVTGTLLPPGGPTADQPIPLIQATEVVPAEAPLNPYG